MKLEFIKVVLMGVLLTSPVMALSETLEEKKVRVEFALNKLFKEATLTSAKKLDATKKIMPFALVLKQDGTTGVYQAGDTEKNAQLSVVQQVSAIRNALVDLGKTKQIQAYAQVMYAGLQQGEKRSQGLSIELEHIEGASLMRFVPVTQLKDESGVLTGKLQIELGEISTTVKPKVVFAQ